MQNPSPETVPTFRELLEFSPELAELRDNAVSVASNETTPWYENWLPGSMVFRNLCSAVAAELGVPRADITRVMQTGLIDAYRAAQRRRKRRDRPGATKEARTST
jgi:hypothetical protein